MQGRIPAFALWQEQLGISIHLALGMCIFESLQSSATLFFVTGYVLPKVRELQSGNPQIISNMRCEVCASRAPSEEEVHNNLKAF